MLNSSIASLIISSYTVETSISAHVLQNVFIPQFDPGDKLYLKLSKQSEKAHRLAKMYYERNDSGASEQISQTEHEIDYIALKYIRFLPKNSKR
jgi:hypothetical protein